MKKRKRKRRKKTVNQAVDDHPPATPAIACRQILARFTHSSTATSRFC
jgi:cytidine deaminase